MSSSYETRRFGRVQLRIMQILWRRKCSPAREITDRLNELYPTEPVAHSTVQTLLRGLEEKGAISHKAESRTFLFYPLVEEGDFKQSVLGDVLERVFGGSATGLMSHLVKHEKISPNELKAIRRLIEQGGGEAGKNKEDDEHDTID